MEELLQFLTLPISAITVAVFLAVIVERVNEYIVVPLLDVFIDTIVKFVSAVTKKQITYELVGKSRSVVITCIGFAMYWLLLGYDFMSGMLSSMGVVVLAWQGSMLSALLISGGSNFVHDTFKYVQSKKDSTKEELELIRAHKNY